MLLIKGKFVSTICELKELRKDSLKWAKNNRGGVNTTKTELLLFTRKYKEPVFELPNSSR